MKIIDRKIHIKSNFIKIDGVTVETDSGQVISRDVVDKCDGVGAVVRNVTRGTYLFVKQFRIGSFSDMVEIPAGLVDFAGLTPEETMKKEILEETGFKTSYIEYLLTYYSSVGYSTEKLHLYYAEVEEKVTDGGGSLDEHEFIEVIEMTKKQIKKFNFQDGKSLIALKTLKLL